MKSFSRGSPLMASAIHRKGGVGFGAVEVSDALIVGIMDQFVEPILAQGVFAYCRCRCRCPCRGG